MSRTPGKAKMNRDILGYFQPGLNSATAGSGTGSYRGVQGFALSENCTQAKKIKAIIYSYLH
jgi:hypothetical protein